ncbi:MAG: hypothetical protein WC289_04570 [Patescibacteria group bacterium]
MSDESTERIVSSSDHTEVHEKLQKTGNEKIKMVLRRLVLWGIISASAIEAFSPGTVEAHTEESKDKGKDAISMLIEKYGLSEQVASEGMKFVEKQISATEFRRVVERMLVGDYARETRGEGIKIKEVATRGFDEIGYDSEKLRQILLETYPEGWVDTEIDTFEYKKNVLPLVGGIAISDSYGSSNVLIDTHGSTRSSSMDDIIAHESGHVNDWESDNTFSAKDRLQLLERTARRYFTGDNLYDSWYVETKTDPDIQKQNYIRLKEYWAEICAAYFTNNIFLKKNHPEDFALVDEWVKKHDDTYDASAQSNNRKVSFGEAELDARFLGLPERAQTEIDSLVLSYARDRHRQLLLKGNWEGIERSKLEKEIQQIFERAHFGEDFTLFAEYVTNKILVSEPENESTWDQEIFGEYLSRLDPNLQSELMKYRSEIIKKVADASAQSSVDFTTLEEDIRKDVRVIYSKFGVTEDPQWIVQWLLRTKQ